MRLSKPRTRAKDRFLNLYRVINSKFTNQCLKCILTALVFLGGYSKLFSFYPAFAQSNAITCSSSDLSPITVNSSNSYECDILTEGSLYYTDRNNYTLLTVPNELQGTAWIKTPNNDKNRTDGEGFLTVTPFKDVIVYVGRMILGRAMCRTG